MPRPSKSSDVGMGDHAREHDRRCHRRVASPENRMDASLTTDTQSNIYLDSFVRKSTILFIILTPFHIVVSFLSACSAFDGFPITAFRPVYLPRYGAKLCVKHFSQSASK